MFLEVLVQSARVRGWDDLIQQRRRDLYSLLTIIGRPNCEPRVAEGKGDAFHWLAKCKKVPSRPAAGQQSDEEMAKWNMFACCLAALF